MLAPGSLEVIAGPMFAGKTETLIERVRIATEHGFRTAIVRPSTDTRSPPKKVASHSGHTWTAEIISPEGEGLPHDVQVLGIDEAQFLTPVAIPRLLFLIQERRVRVIAAGLDLTSQGEPFGATPTLLSLADSVTKLRAICARCSSPFASRTFRVADLTDTVLVGGAESYEPRCLGCHSQHVTIL